LPLVPKPQDAKLQRNGEVAFASVSEDELGRPATDVEKSHAASGEIEGPPRAQVDEVGLFLAANDAHLDPELVAHRSHEFPAVLRLADGAGRHRQQGVRAMAISDTLESTQRVETSVENVRRDDAAVQRLAEANDLFGAVEDIDTPGRIDMGDNEVKRVRSDIQRCDSHIDDVAVTAWLRRVRARGFGSTIQQKAASGVVWGAKDRDGCVILLAP
jgi:hypothetical protein